MHDEKVNCRQVYANHHRGVQNKADPSCSQGSENNIGIQTSSNFFAGAKDQKGTDHHQQSDVLNHVEGEALQSLGAYRGHCYCEGQQQREGQVYALHDFTQGRPKKALFLRNTLKEIEKSSGLTFQDGV